MIRTLHEYLKQRSRTQLLALALLAMIAVFGLRLFYLQVIRHDHYLAAADRNQVSRLTIPAERGEVYALSDGQPVPLVLNESVYTVFADPQEVTDRSAVEQALRDIAGGNVLTDSLALLDDKELRYVPVARQISRKQAELLKERDLTGLGFQEANRRVYPEGDLAAQTLGFVNAAGEGQYGIEQALDDRLSGQAGLLQTVTDVRQIPLTIGNDDIRIPAQDGDDIVLSIDRSIQSKAEEVLARGLKNAKATIGSLMVMDPNSGQVLAMASAPSYDPAKYFEVEDAAHFSNPVVANPYEAGSVIKVLSVGAGLGSGAVTPQSTFNNTNATEVDGVIIRNVEEDPLLPNATMTDVLEYSLNTGVVHVLKQMGGGEVNLQARRTLHDYYTNHYRFGRVTGIEQAGEQAGMIPEPTGIQGPNVTYAAMAFGQAMQVTMVQTAAAFSASINGGTYYKPTVIAGQLDERGRLIKQPPQIVDDQVFSPEQSAELRDMIWQGRKRGFFGDLDPEGYKIGGKTGTSQVVDPETGRYSEDKETGSYLGFGGVDKPRYVIMVRVMDPNNYGYAGTTAAGPIFNDMNAWMIDHLNLQPKL